jgi:beta-galactosidase
MKRLIITSIVFIVLFDLQSYAIPSPRTVLSFNNHWKFIHDDVPTAMDPSFDDSKWRELNLPHDWSIEGDFSEKNPATVGGGALPGGIGWYRKTFSVPMLKKDLAVFVDFDGVYRNSEVWINGHYLGLRPYGYSSFRYEITPYLKEKDNVIAVKVDNSKQPNSRWYSGSGIYRNVWLVTTGRIFVDQWGTYVTTPGTNAASGQVNLKTNVRNNTEKDQSVTLNTLIFDQDGKKVAQTSVSNHVLKNNVFEFNQDMSIASPKLWSLELPYLYKVVSQVLVDGKISDEYETKFGVRYFEFDIEKGFLLNGQQVKIKGVCDHHDLGCLGAAVNTRALERQLEMLKVMGCNGIRTSHNPPAPELLSLADKMGFIIMDEAFDMWKKQKNPFDYHLDWDKWHKQDLEDMVRRDRNHPCIFIWSIGNEIPEQSDSTGIAIARELAVIVKNLDKTRPITSACDKPRPGNYIIKSGALDLVGYNYHQQLYADFPKTFPNQKFIGTETTSALNTRGHYDMPSDSIRRWPVAWDKPFTTGNSDFTCSDYDNCSAPWGSTHEETWKIIKKYDFLSGIFIWTGFDYLGEPTPYPWPAKSSYFGIIDLAGFPKNAFYMYQSEWTTKPVLHIFPHWNWEKGQTIDVWAYYNNADEVELFLNGKSQGIKKKDGDDLHVFWRLPYEPGVLKAISRNNGKEVLTEEVKTAGAPARIVLSADRNMIKADGNDLSFVTVKVVDADGTVVPYADNIVRFELTGDAFIAGVDNGSQISHEPFKANYRKAFNGLCLAVIQSKEKQGKAILRATSDGLKESSIEIQMK